MHPRTFGDFVGNLLFRPNRHSYHIRLIRPVFGEHGAVCRVVTRRKHFFDVYRGYYVPLQRAATEQFPHPWSVGPKRAGNFIVPIVPNNPGNGLPLQNSVFILPNYWQAMSPYRSDYARIRIPVLTIDGYYGDRTALGYFSDLQRYNPAARNYLVAGPWDHFGSQGPTKPDVLRDYRIDPVAHIDTWQLTFDWFDFVMRGKPRPALVRN